LIFAHGNWPFAGHWPGKFAIGDVFAMTGPVLLGRQIVGGPQWLVAIGHCLAPGNHSKRLAYLWFLICIV